MLWLNRSPNIYLKFMARNASVSARLIILCILLFHLFAGIVAVQECTLPIQFLFPCQGGLPSTRSLTGKLNNPYVDLSVAWQSLHSRWQPLSEFSSFPGRLNQDCMLLVRAQTQWPTILEWASFLLLLAQS